MIFGIAGLPFSGKKLLVDYLVEEHGFIDVKIDDELPSAIEESKEGKVSHA
jgi:hypothetical protein